MLTLTLTFSDPVVIDYRQDTNLHTFREGYFVTAGKILYIPIYEAEISTFVRTFTSSHLIHTEVYLRETEVPSILTIFLSLCQIVHTAVSSGRCLDIKYFVHQ